MLIYLIVPHTDIAYRLVDNCWQNSYEFDCEGNRIWCWTFRGEREIREMHPTILNLDPLSNTTLDDESNEREIFGETLDEEIPDYLWELIRG